MTKNISQRDLILELASLSQLTYEVNKQTPTKIENILIQGCLPFVQTYKSVEFLYTRSSAGNSKKIVPCGFVASNSENLVIAIRGTENLEDYYYNLLAIPNTQTIHSGFNSYVNSFWGQLVEIINSADTNQKNIFITGHSLGGAAAILISQRLSLSSLLSTAKSAIYVFGSPPVSTQKLNLNVPVCRFVNSGDFIPHLPQMISSLMIKTPGLRKAISAWQPDLPELISKYSHEGREYQINSEYQISEVTEPDIGGLKQWLRLSQIILLQLRQTDSSTFLNNQKSSKFNQIIKSLIEESLLEHRAIEYLRRLNYGQLPPWFEHESVFLDRSP
ncbi:MAG: lipase family protein [Cyanobacteria bacterium J06600_6]